ncbi:MAG: hypothetical protein CMC95_01960 [Flavobacteriales bacterium]|nr:hypothetical protein [Flavobacteriales bacterium]
MGLKSFFGVQYARWVNQQNAWWINNPIKAQKKVFKSLMSKAEKTAFGKEHGFATISSYKDFKSAVPVRDYEGLKPYIKRALDGEKDVLWKGLPLYFCKTSGTTSGTKYIPISKDSMPYHLKGAKDAILSYVYETSCAGFLNGKNIFIQGSAELDYSKSAPLGRLSGIVAHHVPWYLQRDNTPNFETNCIEGWEEKIEAIIEETISEKMTLISGIPPWIQMYFERLKERTGKEIKDVFPNYSLMVYGGVNFEPYKKRFLELVGKDVPSIETYPASEGFIAYQDKQDIEGLLLCVNHGIFYEFIEASLFFEDKAERISLADVELAKDYVVILNTNAGLWGYNIGDTVRFVSTSPYRVVVSGRIKHFTSAFGEHVIAKEVEEALYGVVKKYDAIVSEFHVAPEVNPSNGLPYHEWFVEFRKQPNDMTSFSEDLDVAMQNQNTYYKDLIDGKILKPLVIRKVQENGFLKYMKSEGKLGGQNKPPRLANNRKLANSLTLYIND